MSAEPARPGPDPRHPATVIPLHTASRPPRRTPRRERTTVVPPAPDLTPEQKLAAFLEDLFAKHGRSLADDDTAEDFRITLGAVRHMFKGAHAQGKIDAEQQRVLDAMIEGMLAAPGFLT